MKFKDNLNEADMKYEALAMAKELHSQLADLTFIEMLSMMSPDNPAKLEVQDLETKINELTNDVGAFIQKYIPDVSDADAGDTTEVEPEEEEEDQPAKKAKAKKAEKKETNESMISFKEFLTEAKEQANEI